MHTIGEHFHYEHKIPYEDLPFLLYIKSYLIGIDTRSEIKYLIIDECQDYSPLVFEVLNQIYPCNKTVLGDIYQTIEKNLDKIHRKYATELVTSEEVILAKENLLKAEESKIKSDIKTAKTAYNKAIGKTLSISPKDIEKYLGKPVFNDNGRI